MVQINATSDVSYTEEFVIEEMRRRGKLFLNNFGEYVVQDAKDSIKRSVNGESSKPGEPPKSHSEQLRDGIAYALDSKDMDELNVAIGAIVHGNANPEQSVPHVLEHGGKVARRFASYEAEHYAKRGVQAATSYAWNKATKAAWRAGPKGKIVAVVLIVARPFIKPALDRAIVDAIRFWDQVVED